MGIAASPEPEQKENGAKAQAKSHMKWDEENLEKNEREKVPRMKIDEPPTPYAERPAELEFGGDAAHEEIVLDGDLEIGDEIEVDGENEMSLDGNEMCAEAENLVFGSELIHSADQIRDQKQQSLLLGDAEYRQKMVDDAVRRRNEWEHSDDDDSPQKRVHSGSMSPEEVDLEKKHKKAKFEKKRKAHYNEFHAIKAMKAKMAAEALENENEMEK